jgi:hypothetical protein
MRVGILTFHDGANYGGYFQVFCMVSAIRDLGHQVEVINYKCLTHYQAHRFRPWVYRRPLKLAQDWVKHGHFKRAVAGLPLHPEKLQVAPENIDWNRYDAIVVGSDIVWNRDLDFIGSDDTYFGRFPTSYGGRLLAYAPSIGPTPPDHPMPGWIGEALERFDFIGVRDPNTASLVERHSGKRPEIVADPTWLAPRVTAAPEAPKSRANRILVYSYSLTGEYADRAREIREFARSHDLRVDATGYYQPWADRNLPSVSPDQWQRLFGEYAYVITGTFHGALFSVREQARFCILSHYSVDPKLETALEVTGLQSRLIGAGEGFGKILETDIDYPRVEAGRREYADRSLGLLRRALS